MAATQSVTLSNGVEMPVLGLGTWQMFDHIEAKKTILTAIEAGYRHIDTAAFYQNEEAVGEAVRECGIDRKEMFIVTKLWNPDHGYEKALKAFDTSMRKLKADYLDLYLVHWPNELNKETWKALEKLYKDGAVRAIGVSNFLKHHIVELLPDCEIKPMVNQFEFHPYLVQPELLNYCREQNIQPEAWSPLMQGNLTDVPLLAELAKKYNRTPAQIVLRWDVQLNIVTIPKSSNPGRIKSNLDIFSFELADEDIKRISELDKFKRFGPDPDNFDF